MAKISDASSVNSSGVVGCCWWPQGWLGWCSPLGFVWMLASSNLGTNVLPIHPLIGLHTVLLLLQLFSSPNLVLVYLGSLAGVSWLVRCHYQILLKSILELLSCSPLNSDSCPAVSMNTMMMSPQMIAMIGALEDPATPPVLILSGRVFL